MDNFTASVKYNDSKGSIATDMSDTNRPDSWLSKQGLISSEEYVLGLRMYTGEIHGSSPGTVGVEFLVTQLDNGDRTTLDMIQANDDSLVIRAINKTMEIEDFFIMFKRFEVTMSRDGVLEGKDYNAVESTYDDD